MATRSLIGYLEDGLVFYRYCHYDGYPSGVGQTLFHNYDLDDVKQLMALGDIHSLGDDIKTTLDYVYPDSNELPYTVSLKEYHTEHKHFGAEYVYLYQDDTWYYKDTYEMSQFKELTDEDV